ncbi:Glycoside hydrolase, family 32 [Cynara cardunculus var. scolymus]|uniref:Glycoside hydrolase, family 32 n=1 Tax=Cynara cardunculus var. scolymus TaxID=59895 RepID=A0A103Y8E5_CYNCS|nr:Glycoside hydrolase, family 32 [Cynara cardunculus var. scolymus]
MALDDHPIGTDPNGPMYFNGVYHLFYQHNPAGPLFTNKMHWGHSASYDLINWIPLDLAIAPTESFDINSCWSGSATILPGNKPESTQKNARFRTWLSQRTYLIYDPYLREWVKYTSNPVINLPQGVQPDNFRDPTTAWLAGDEKWRVIVGGEKDKAGIAFLYQSEDFFSWTAIDSPLYEAAGTGTWECPDFFSVWIDSKKGVETSVMNPSVKHVMKMGLLDQGKDYYLIGNYSSEKENYVPENELTLNSLRFDYGKYYASKSFFDPVKCRRISIAWVTESDSEADNIAKGWAGLQVIQDSYSLILIVPKEPLARSKLEATHTVAY